MSASLVGSEMCIRDRFCTPSAGTGVLGLAASASPRLDAASPLDSPDLELSPTTSGTGVGAAAPAGRCAGLGPTGPSLAGSSLPASVAQGRPMQRLT
eukprot:6343172-Alexandrium_andersonii.AAC.1